MPYLHFKTTLSQTNSTKQKIVDILLQHTTHILGKKPEVTSISLEFISRDDWLIGGTYPKEPTFYLEIKITEGTNTKSQKANYIKEVFADLNAAFGPLAPASYIVIHDLPGDCWGFEGRTQEYRFIQSQNL